jgi:ETC complex I subunit conserved region
MTSGKACSKGWRLIFDRRSAPYVEPLMGWTGNDDPLAAVELSFPTLRAAVDYAERQGLPYVVQDSWEQNATQLKRVPRKLTRAFSDDTSNASAVAGAEARRDRRGEEG